MNDCLERFALERFMEKQYTDQMDAETERIRGRDTETETEIQTYKDVKMPRCSRPGERHPSAKS